MKNHLITTERDQRQRQHVSGITHAAMRRLRSKYMPRQSLQID